MRLIRLYMTVSLDGYVAGPRDGVDAPLGIGGFRLFNRLERRNDRCLTDSGAEEPAQHVTHLRYRVRRP